MKFTCEKALLQARMGIACRAVASKSSIPALEGLLLETGNGLTVSGYNMKTGIRAHVSADVTGLAKSSSTPASSGTSSARCRMTSSPSPPTARGRSTSAAATPASTSPTSPPRTTPSFPEVEDEQFVVLQQRTLREMIEQCAFAVSTNEARPVHTGALFEIGGGRLTMVAVDGFRLAVRREPLEKASGEFSFVAPGSALNEMKSICADTEDLVTVMLGRRHILFEVGDTELICRRLEGEFLDYRNAIPRKNPIVVTAETRALINCIDRVSVVISDKLKSPVRCRL